MSTKHIPRFTCFASTGADFCACCPHFAFFCVFTASLQFLKGSLSLQLRQQYGRVYLIYFNWLYIYSLPKGDLGYLWSLSIEEQFYIVWPAVLILLLKITKRAILHISFIAVLIALVFWHRHVLWTTPSQTTFLYQIRLLVRTDARIDTLLVGCMTAFIYRYQLISVRISQLLAILGALIVLMYIEFSVSLTGYMFSGGFTVVAVGVACLILGLTVNTFPLTRLFQGRLIVLIGKTSYGIYLWHFPIFTFVNRHMTNVNESYKVITALFFTALFTTASWILIETPALRLKKRKFSTTR